MFKTDMYIQIELSLKIFFELQFFKTKKKNKK